MKKIWFGVLFSLVLISPNIANAAVVQAAFAGTDSHTVDFAKYGGACFTISTTKTIKSASVGITRTGQPGNAVGFFRLINNSTNTAVWTIGTSDNTTGHGTYTSIATSTTSFTLTPAQYCFVVGSNTGNENFIGDSNDGGLSSQAYGASLGELIANQAGSAVAYFGSVNYSLCDDFTTDCSFSTNTQSHIDWVNPPEIHPAATTTSRGVNWTFDYYLNSGDDPNNEINSILLQLYPIAYPNDETQRITITQSLNRDQFTRVSLTATTTRDGYYLGLVSFWNGVTTDVECSWWNIFCEPETSLIFTTNSNNFNIATTSIAADIPPVIESLLSGCSTGGFFDAPICKTLVYLFMPSAEAYGALTSLGDQLAIKLPFNFFYQPIQKINALSSSTLSIGSDVMFDAHGTFIQGEVTLFSWQAAHDGIRTMMGTSSVQYIENGSWIVWSMFAISMILISI